MAIANLKDILKEFNLSRKHFANGIKMAKQNLIIGSVNFQTDPAPRKRVKRAKADPPPADKDLPDMDKQRGGYMSKRQEES